VATVVTIFINPAQNGEYLVELRVDGQSVAQVPTRIDRATLLLHEHEYSATDYGMELFDAIFIGRVGREYQRLVGKAGSDETLRVQLVISDFARELHALPWERLFHEFGDAETPLAASVRTPFSRFLITGAARLPPVAERPLRLLIVIANPENLPPALAAIDVDAEVAALADALAGLRGQASVTLLPGRSGLPDALRGRLEREGWQVIDGPASWRAIQRSLPGQHVLHAYALALAQGAGEATTYRSVSSAEGPRANSRGNNQTSSLPIRAIGRRSVS
jgi:hypothetical protein